MNYYSSTYEHKTKKNNFFFLLLFIISFLSIGFGLYTYIFSSQNQIISPLPNGDTPHNPLTILFQKKPADPQELLLEIKTLIDKQPGRYSVYIKDINKNTGFGINENTIYTAASVNKIPVLAALYYEAQRGKIDLDERITIQPADIQDYGTGIIRYEGAGGVYSLKTLAQLMMQKSDNTAVYVLIHIVGESRIQELVTSWGMTQTDIVNNKTSNTDMALLLSKMFKGQITNEASSLEMLDFMTGSDFENRLPLLLPKTTKIYHKIGSEIANVHDVGIVSLANQPYYIGVFTADVLVDTAAENMIAQISKRVFDFMSSQ